MKKPIVVDEELYTIPEACKALGIDRRTLRRYTTAGVIACHRRKCDGRLVYYGADIHKCYYEVF